MSERKISFELLSAYVDGELDPATAAEVASAVSREPALAREVAALARLRTAVAASVEGHEPVLPARPRKGRAMVAAVAGIVVAALVGAGALMLPLLPWGQRAESQGSWMAAAWRAHRAWDLEGPPVLHPATLSGPPTLASILPYVPDLSSARLSLVRSEVTSLGPGRDAVLAGYRGTRGCRITLLAFAAPESLDAALTPVRDGASEGYRWRVGPLAYVLLSQGMDSRRFRLLAQSVYQATRERLPFDDETRIALRESRARSAPCVA